MFRSMRWAFIAGILIAVVLVLWGVAAPGTEPGSTPNEYVAADRHGKAIEPAPAVEPESTRTELTIEDARTEPNVVAPRNPIPPQVLREESKRFDQSIKGSWERIEALRKQSGYGTDTELSAKEADDLLRIARHEACLDLLRAGEVTVMKHSRSRPPEKKIPDTIVFHGPKILLSKSENVQVRYVVTKERNPRLWGVREMRNRTWLNLYLEEVRAFNALPFDQRRAWVLASREAKRKRKELSPNDYTNWATKNLPKGGPPVGSLDQETYILRADR
jgi:hypothetical protein